MTETYLYLLATTLFIFGIKGLSKVRSARNGNRLAAIGMMVAIVGALLEGQVLSPLWIIVGVVVGGGIGAVLAARVPLTAMPELVAAFNGTGGAASAFVALASLVAMAQGTGVIADHVGIAPAVTLPITILIGTATFTGSGVAYLKLTGKKMTHPVSGTARHYVNAALALVLVLASVWMVAIASTNTTVTIAALTVLVISGILGVLLVLPIGGADMPVVVALLNSYSGVAAATSGFVIGNSMLMVAGALVGASGLILTKIMCKAMNRSLANVLVGGIGDDAQAEDARDYGNIKETSPEEVAMLFDSATSVIMVPGYGLAVAQAQHVMRELGELLEKRGANVRYAIHPVAGRMPGHMNVLLAEADVSYDKLYELEKINSDFRNTDVVVVVGANDVVNPAAREDPGSPIAGMPILDVDDAQTVVVVKRSLSPGYAGIKNPLFDKTNCLMVFMDAKKALEDMVTEVKDL
ncbi:MAG: NAD(P)(+) transhydrogenase (Re/Si-specific) subunit beta [Planctomycetota bacterium]